MNNLEKNDVAMKNNKRKNSKGLNIIQINNNILTILFIFYGSYTLLLPLYNTQWRPFCKLKVRPGLIPLP